MNAFLNNDLRTKCFQLLYHSLTYISIFSLIISIFSQKVKISASTNSFLQLFIYVQWMVVLAYGQLGQLAVKHVVLVPSLEADCATTLFLPIKVKIAAVTSIKPKAVNWHHALVGNFKRVMSSAMRITNFQKCSGALYEKVLRNVTLVPTKYLPIRLREITYRGQILKCNKSASSKSCSCCRSTDS